MIKVPWLKVTSASTIKRMRYDNEILDVEFQDYYERFYRVPIKLMNDIMGTSSLRSFLEEKVKPNRPSYKIDLDVYEEQIRAVQEQRISAVDFAKILDERLLLGMPDDEFKNLLGLSEQIRQSLVYVEKLPKTILDELCKDSSMEVKTRVLTRTDLTKDQLKLLAKKAEGEFAELARKRF